MTSAKDRSIVGLLARLDVVAKGWHIVDYWGQIWTRLGLLGRTGPGVVWAGAAVWRSEVSRSSAALGGFILFDKNGDAQVTRFDDMRAHLEGAVARMSVNKRALFLLAYAQRLSGLFEEFERRAPRRSVRFEGILDRLWHVASGGAADLADKSVLEDMIPGEEWVVDGFYDTLAQNVGGLAIGALEAMLSPGATAWRPEVAVFDTIRLLLAEMRLGRTEPGEDAVGKSFDDLLHTEPLVEAERQFWVDLVESLEASSLRPEELRSLAVRGTLDVSSLQPELAQGLAKDATNANPELGRC